MWSAIPLREGDLAGIAILIPAWEPEHQLVLLVKGLATAGFGAIVVVDDGSGPASGAIFKEVSALHRVCVLKHAVNLGKGRALKTGLNFVLTQLPYVQGVVTADADGQHCAEDILRVANELRCRSRLVLGARRFDGTVPLRSRFGNTFTRYVFWFIAGRKITDTQSGLRGIPRTHISGLMQLPGERYEYEMNMLAHLCRCGETPVEVPIATIYLEQNRASHFEPIRDSMRIYFVLLRFLASSVIAAGLDIVIFAVVYAASHRLLFSMVCGRLSSLVNFALNKRFVFNSRTSLRRSLPRYYVVFLLLASLSYGSIRLLTSRLGWNILVAKCLVEAALWVLSFSVQRTLVFERDVEG